MRRSSSEKPSLVEVTFPLRPRGMSWTRQAADRNAGAVDPDAGTDLQAVANDMGSLTSSRPDLTDHEALAGSAGAAAR